MNRKAEEGQGFRSPLGAYAPQMREADPSQGREACRLAWQNHGLIVFNPAHFGWASAARMKQMAEEHYGKRREDEA